jgi:hypothetical protein
VDSVAVDVLESLPLIIDINERVEIVGGDITVCISYI